jgi:hypothetical protein
MLLLGLMNIVLDNSCSLELYSLLMVLTELEQRNYLDYESLVLVTLLVWYIGHSWIFSKSGGLIYCSKYGVERGYSLWNNSRVQVLPFMAKPGGVCQLDITCPLLH